MKPTTTESVTVARSYDFSFPTRESIEKNGEHIIVHTSSQLEEDTGGGVACPKMESSILDPQTGMIYTTMGKILSPFYFSPIINFHPSILLMK